MWETLFSIFTCTRKVALFSNFILHILFLKVFINLSFSEAKVRKPFKCLFLYQTIFSLKHDSGAGAGVDEGGVGSRMSENANIKMILLISFVVTPTPWLWNWCRSRWGEIDSELVKVQVFGHEIAIFSGESILKSAHFEAIKKPREELWSRC